LGGSKGESIHIAAKAVGTSHNMRGDTDTEDIENYIKEYEKEIQQPLP
jgi:hypothetical protein